MIIFGTRGVKSTIKEGQFLCPQCANNQKYKHKKVTRFFTLYFIPLIPLGSAGEFVECQGCKGTFIPRVLDYSKSNHQNDFQSEYEKAMKHSMVLIMLADGVIDENEMLVVQKIINKFGHHDITLGQLSDYVEKVQKNPEDITTYLKRVTPSLNEHGKEIIIKCAVSVAAADGSIDESEMILINEMAKTMEMSASHLKGILAEMFEPQNSAYSKN
ncbi:MAG: TerB family tellurite resistance protein [Saprospiraceae bacterium]|nr:TerB family tellurite resistance protein [Saprospiraceae bacterium]MCB9323124.1 TerB family tellurite resistance protein [Lewinellaceae bacterium]